MSSARRPEGGGIAKIESDDDSSDSSGDSDSESEDDDDDFEYDSSDNSSGVAEPGVMTTGTIPILLSKTYIYTPRAYLIYYHTINSIPTYLLPGPKPLVFFFILRRMGKIKLTPTTIQRIFIHVVCRFNDRPEA